MGLLFRMFAPRSAKKLRRAAHPVSLVTPRAVKKTKMAVVDVTHPVGATERAAKRQAVKTVRNPKKHGANGKASRSVQVSAEDVYLRILSEDPEFNTPIPASDASTAHLSPWNDPGLRGKIAICQAEAANEGFRSSTVVLPDIPSEGRTLGYLISSGGQAKPFLVVVAPNHRDASFKPLSGRYGSLVEAEMAIVGKPLSLMTLPQWTENGAVRAYVTNIRGEAALDGFKSQRVILPDVTNIKTVGHLADEDGRVRSFVFELKKRTVTWKFLPGVYDNLQLAQASAREQLG